MERKIDIAVIGECLIELYTDNGLSDAISLNKFYGGDTITTAVAATRMGSNLAYITKIGSDGFSDFILSSLEKENIDTSFITKNEEQNGMYIVSKNEDKKELLYYKRKTAATKLSINDFKEEDIKKLKLIYSTGIVQSLSPSARELVSETFKIAKSNDVITAYDPNYTSCFMNSQDTKEFFEEIIPYTDILFLSLKNDATKLYEFDNIDKIMKYFWDKGVKIIILKSHIDKGYYTGYSGDINFTEYYSREKAVDTAISGDVFNGGYIYAITSGYAPLDATRFAAVLAGLQTQNYGEIRSIPYSDLVLEKL